MNATTNFDCPTMKRKMQEQNAKDALLIARATLERAIRDLDNYVDRLESAKTALDKSRVMNWALNALVSNITPNLRLDLIANAQAELASSAE